MSTIEASYAKKIEIFCKIAVIFSWSQFSLNLASKEEVESTHFHKYDITGKLFMIYKTSSIKT